MPAIETPTPPLSPVELAETISVLSHDEFAIFHKALLDKLICKTPGVMGGAACIRQTRISVWILVSLSQQGVDETELLEDYPSLTLLDLWAAQTYYKANRQEIDDLTTWHSNDALNLDRFARQKIYPQSVGMGNSQRSDLSEQVDDLLWQ